MSQAPYMPVFTDALLGDTTHLTAEEFGSYCLILFATWRNNGEPLADDDGMLRRVVRCSVYKWRRLRTVLVKFFNIDDGTWRQKRLEKEWRRTQEIIAAKRSKDGGPQKSDENISKKFSATSLNQNETEKQPNPGSPPSAGEPLSSERDAPSASPPDGGQGREPPPVGQGIIPASIVQQETNRWGVEAVHRALLETERRHHKLLVPIAYFRAVCKGQAANPQTSFTPASPPGSGPPAWMLNLSLDELRALAGASA